MGIDDALLAKNTKMQADEEIIEMMNGCICCTVRQDLIQVLEIDRPAMDIAVKDGFLYTLNAGPIPELRRYNLPHGHW